MSRAWIAAAVMLVAGCAPSSFVPTGAPSVPSPDRTTVPAVVPATPTADATTSRLLPLPIMEPFEPRSVSINVSGDLLWHNSLWFSAEADGDGGMDFVPQLASIGDYVGAADIAVCHSEVPFAPVGGPYLGYPLFAAPQEIAEALAEIGWDICTTASNHTLDQGWEGLVRTVDIHQSAGIRTVGSYRTEEEARTPVIVDSGTGVRVGFVSQTYGLNGIRKPEGRPWSVELLDADAAIAAASRAREAGADIVAVHMHAGDEYVHAPSRQQRDFAEAVTASEHVDLVFGQHAHVVQPIEEVNGKWVVYGTGNLIAQSGPAKPYTYDGMIVQVTFTETEPGVFAADGVEWAPTMITRYTRSSPARVYFIPTEIHERPELADAMAQSAARTRRIVRDADGLTEVS